MPRKIGPHENFVCLTRSMHICRLSVDGTLIEAWASMKSFVPKDGDKPPSGKGHGGSGCRNADSDFTFASQSRGQVVSNVKSAPLVP